MKKYMFRRIVAGAMALLTVAAYTPLADFTALQQPNAIVAVARDAALTSKSLTETAWEKGDYFEENAEFITPTNKTISLNFANVTKESGKDIYYGTDGETTPTTLLTFKPAKLEGGKIVEDEESNFTNSYNENDLALNFTAVQSVKYVSGTTNKMEVTFGDAGNPSYAIVTVTNGYYLSVGNATTSAGSATYGLEAKKAQDTYELLTTDSSLKDVITSLSFTDKDDVVQTLDATASRGNYDVMAKTVVTVTSGALLKFDGNDGDMDDYLDRTASDFENAKYVYKFNMLEDRKIIAEKQAVKFALASGADDPEKLELNDGDEITYSVGKSDPITYTHSSSSPSPFNDFGDALKGGLVTVSSATPFRIATGKYEMKEGSQVLVYTYSKYAEGVYTATFVNSVDEKPAEGFVNNVLVEFIHHEHTLSYTGNGTNELTASCADGDLVNVSAATVYAEVPSATEGQPADQLANNSTVAFTEEADELASLVFEVDSNLLSTVGSGTDARHYVATVVMGDYKFTYTLPKDYADATITPQVYKKGTGGQFSTTAMTLEQLTAAGIDLTKFSGKPRPGATPQSNPLPLTEGFTLAPGIFFTKGGNYTASLEIYSKAATSSPMTVNYKYTVAPSEAINENAMEVWGGYYGGEPVAEEPRVLNEDEWKIASTNINGAVSVVENGAKREDVLFEIYEGSGDYAGQTAYILVNSSDGPDGGIIGMRLEANGTKKVVNRTSWEDMQEYFKPKTTGGTKYEFKATKNADGVYVFPIEKSKLKSNFMVTFKFRKQDKNGKLLDAYYGDDGKEYFYVDGATKGNILENPYKVSITVSSASYKQDEALKNIQWMLVEKEELSDLYYEFEKDDSTEIINTKSISNTTSPKKVNYTAVEEQLKGFLKTTREDIDVTKAKFQYMTLADYVTMTDVVNGNVDLDAMHDGVPKLTSGEMIDSNVNKDFVVFASVGSVTTAYPIAITVTDADKTPVHAVLNKLVYEYGERITLDDLSFVTATGTEVKFDKKDIAEQGTKGDKKVDNTKITFYKIGANGQPASNKTIIKDAAGEGVYFLEPGKYQVTLNNNDKGSFIKFVEGNADNTTRGYEFIEEDATVATYTITVNKREIDPTMFGDYTADLKDTPQAKVTNTTYSKSKGNIFLPDDAMEDLVVTIKSGVSNATKVGTYTVTLEPTGDSANYYSGTASVNWYATRDDTAQLPDLIWSKKKQNIYRGKDGSIQVHVEAFQAKMGATTDITDGVYNGNDVTTVRATTPSAITTAFGFVYDKTQAFPKNADPNEVAKSLKLDADGGFKGQKATNAVIKDGLDTNGNKTSSGCTTGLNFTVNSVDDYYWVRPYETTDGGVPKYGKPIMVDFQTIAQEVLQPTLDSVKLVQKTVSGKADLYYYVYATKYTRTNEGDRTIQPDRWGIVLDRTGNYGATVADDKFDYESLTLENCDAHSEALKNSTKYKEDEVGTLIKITDSLSRVYVRNYIDFGNGLVVYNKAPEKGVDEVKGYTLKNGGGDEIDSLKYAALPDERNQGENTKIKADYYPSSWEHADKYFTESASATLAKAIGLQTKGKVNTIEGSNTKKVAMAAIRDQYTNANSDVVTIPARPTLNTMANAQQVFEDIIIDNRENNAETENKLTGWGVVVDRTGAAFNVWKEKYMGKPIPADFFTASDYTVYNAANVNGDNYTAGTLKRDSETDDINKNNVVVYTLYATAPKADALYTFRAVAEYKGVAIYGDVWFANTNDADEASKATSAIFN